jgi:serine/threonine-protein kinase RsbW
VNSQPLRREIVQKIEIPAIEVYETAYQQYLTHVAMDLNIPLDLVKNVKFYLERKFELTIPSETSNLELLRRLIQGFVANVELSPQAVEDIGLAVDEACTNIVKHSYTQEQSGKIDVSVEISRDYVIISMTDTGEKGQFFDPTHMEPFEKKKYLERLERGGLGVYIIKTIMDEVEYNIQPGAYNRLRMVKYIRKPKTDSSDRA